MPPEAAESSRKRQADTDAGGQPIKVIKFESKPLPWALQADKKLPTLKSLEVSSSISNISEAQWRYQVFVALTSIKAVPKYACYQGELMSVSRNRADAAREEFDTQPLITKEYRKSLSISVKTMRRAITNLEQIQLQAKVAATKIEAAFLQLCLMSCIITCIEEDLEDHVLHPTQKFESLLTMIKGKKAMTDSTCTETTKAGAVSIGTMPQPNNLAGQLPSFAGTLHERDIGSTPTTHGSISGSKADYLATAREFFVDPAMYSKDVSWDDIKGLDALKRLLEFEMDACTVKTSRDCQSPGSFLLFGPGGTGKSSIVLAFAKKFKLPLYVLDTSIKDRWIGSTERSVKALFEILRAQRAVLLLEEVDGLLHAPPTELQRDIHSCSIVSYIKKAWDELTRTQSKVFVFGTTNHPNRLPVDDVNRRFSHRAMVSLPGPNERAALIQLHLRDDFTFTKTELRRLARKADGLTGADIKRIGNWVGMQVIVASKGATQESPVPIESVIRKGQLRAKFRLAARSVTEAMIRRHVDFAKAYGGLTDNQLKKVEDLPDDQSSDEEIQQSGDEEA